MVTSATRPLAALPPARSNLARGAANESTEPRRRVFGVRVCVSQNTAVSVLFLTRRGERAAENKTGVRRTGVRRGLSAQAPQLRPPELMPREEAAVLEAPRGPPLLGRVPHGSGDAARRYAA